MKYQTGQYIAHDNSIFLKIVVALEEDNNNDNALVTYGTRDIKNPGELSWQTEKELDRAGYKVKKPNFRQFKDVKPGDFIKIYKGDYIQVLARVGSAVLLSKSKSDTAEQILNMAESMEEHGVEIISAEKKRELRHETSVTYSKDVAGGWTDIKTMALMNWTLVNDKAELETQPESQDDLKKQLKKLMEG